MAAAEPLIVQITLTEAERISGVPEPCTVEKALEALHRDGSPVSKASDSRNRRSEQCSTPISEIN